MAAGVQWRPAATPEVLRQRAEMLAAIRQFFAERGILEVDTPALSAAAATDPHLDSFSTVYRGPGYPAGQPLWLHTSPEFPMKRLLAAGSGPIYQICKVFRQGEAGRLHNPEFTLLEWYRPGYDHHALMAEMEGLASRVLGPSLMATEYLPYGAAFQRYAGIDPFMASDAALKECALAAGISAPASLAADDRDGWLQLLLTHLIEPRLGVGRLCFVYDFPASQAALARVRPGEQPLAERFELYLEGVELANGFHELSDAAEQRARFEADLLRRQAQSLPGVPVDERLLAALSAGLPDCAGVALGIDRLLMFAAKAQRIEEVIAFPIDQA